MTYKIIQIRDPIPYLRIENLYNEEELNLIWQELDFFTYSTKMDNEKHTMSARDDNNNVLKKNNGVFLEKVFSERRYSNILNVNRKVFNLDIKESFMDLSFGYQSLLTANHDTTLISYYENGGFYKPHVDHSYVTILTWFFREPKKFKGGNFYFDEYDVKIEVENNLTIMFPSFLYHAVDEIQMDGEEFSGFGRYCMTQFVSIDAITATNNYLNDVNDFND